MARSWVEIAPGVLVATSRRYATTSTLVLDGLHACVVDPAWDADELAAVAEEMSGRGPGTVVGLATHRHYDHVLWHPGLGAGPRWASAATAAALAADRGALLAPLLGDVPDDLVQLAGRVSGLPGDSDPLVLPWAGREVRCWRHDAHAPGHLAVEVPDARVLLAGDMLSDIELPMPDDDDHRLDQYLTGLDRLAPLVARASLLVPGHGAPTDRPLDRLDADRRYLDDMLAGREPDDARLGLPGMAELHEANRARAAARRSG